MADYEKKYTENLVYFQIPKSSILKIDMDICEQPKETLGHYYNRMKPDILINGGFFNMKSGETCFSFIDDGEIIKDHYGVKAGIGLLKDDKTNLVYGCIDDDKEWYDFTAGYPVLVRDGTPILTYTWASEINYAALRSGLGYNDDYVFIVASTSKILLNQFANELSEIGCKYAINLDGGGSSRLLENGNIVNMPTENRSVDSVIAIYIKKPSDKPNVVEIRPYISYRVKKGDSMWAISTKYLGSGSRYREIMEFNFMRTATLHVGQSLKIPVDCEKYIVKSGDSLWKIAAERLGSGAKYSEIVKFNNLSSTVISPGQVLYIPV